MSVITPSIVHALAGAGSRIHARLEPSSHSTLSITLARDPDGGPQNFSAAVLTDLRQLLDTIGQHEGCWPHEGRLEAIRYAVMRSDHPEHFSVGGDLQHFQRCIRTGDWTALRDYAMSCLDLMHDWAQVAGPDLTTIALIQGRALGGGFETALAADYLIAEEHASFGFPEILFGLFPCTGGYSLLARRIGVQQAERLLTSKRIYSAAELLELGVLDVVCPTGGGQEAVERFIAEHRSRSKARLMLQRARKRMAPLNYAELVQVVDDWVETAKHLTAEELRAMDMLILLQQQGRRAEANSAIRQAA